MLAQIGNCLELRTLHLTFNKLQLTDTDMNTMEFLGKLENVTELRLEFNLNYLKNLDWLVYL